MSSYLIIDTVDTIAYWKREDILALELNAHHNRTIEIIVRSKYQANNAIYKIWQHPDPGQLEKKFTTTKKFFQDTIIEWFATDVGTTNMYVNQTMIFLQRQRPVAVTRTPRYQRHYNTPIGPPKKPAVKRRRLSPSPQPDAFDEEYTV